MRAPERSSHARTLPAPDDASLTLGRRIGVLLVLAALGGAIVLAASGGRSERTEGLGALPTNAVVATPTALTQPGATAGPLVGAPIGQPAFVAPESPLVNKRTIPLRVRVPDPGVPWDGLELRVMRGGTQVFAQAITPEDVNSKGRVTLRGVRLKRGSNKLTVAFANANGPGPASDAITIRLDDRKPRLKVTEPREGVALNADSVTVKGRTVAGMRVIVRNVSTKQKEVVFADGEGRFQAKLDLRRGRATIKVAVEDAAGNQQVREFAIVRGDGKPEARLSLSRERFKRSALPRTLDARVSVLDADGRPVKGARVDFTYGPPGSPPQYRRTTTSKQGTASWSGIRVLKEAATDGGLVTVRVTLPDGRELTDTRKFRVD